MPAKWNRFYELFAASRGRTADEQDAIDGAKPVGRNVEFMTWISEQKRAFCRAHPEAMSSDQRLIADRAAWAAWLEGAAARVATGAAVGLATLTTHTARSWA